MSELSSELPRRTVLQAAAALVAAGTMGAPAARAAELVPAKPTPGKPGDFDFLAGNWAIKHRRLKTAHTQDWDEFEGEATCWSILGGVASIEELRIPARDFSGMGLRLLDVQNAVWSDFWVNGRSGVLTPPGMPGSFENGEGIFTADDMDGDKPIKVKGVWDRITPTSCRWYQAVSWDAGATWEENWVMEWTRVS